MRARNEAVRALAALWLPEAADWLALGVAVALPWSTAATATLMALWIVAALPTLDFRSLARRTGTLAGGLPVLLCALAALGTLWAHVPWAERLAGLGLLSFCKLLTIPLLFEHFRRSERALLILCAFLASASCLLVASWALAFFPGLGVHGKPRGVPVNDYVFQSAIFLACAFALIGASLDELLRHRSRRALFLAAFAMLFLANIVFVVTSRTSIIVAPVLIALLGWRWFGAKGVLGALALVIALGGAAWLGSAYLRHRANVSIVEAHEYWNANEANSTALHFIFLEESIEIVRKALLFGHGTGSIPDEFRIATMGKTGAAGVATHNPHNQVFAVAIQLGLLGTAVLLAMWAAHLALFRKAGLAAWIGTVIVAQNVVSSVFNSHLLDFKEGWLYVLGVGIAGGMILRRRDLSARGSLEGRCRIRSGA